VKEKSTILTIEKMIILRFQFSFIVKLIIFLLQNLNFIKFAIGEASLQRGLQDPSKWAL
jgi:uncharacterized membrane protein